MLAKTLQTRLLQYAYFFALILLLSMPVIGIAQPVINSLSPSHGAAGTEVIISGSQFGTGGTNIVRFGSASAQIIERSDTHLKVKVPSAATYGPVSVTVLGGFTGYSKNPFLLTFNNGGKHNFDGSSFGAKSNFSTGGGTNPTDIFTGDFDNDGKPDIAITNFSAGSISVFRNTTTNGVVSFSLAATIATGTNPWFITGADLDGDGKLDIIVTNGSSNKISVLKNNSTPGNVNFLGKIDYATENGPKAVIVCDINLDGRPDIVVANYGSSSVSVFKNKATGSIAFDNAVNFGTATGPFGLAAADIDGDGKTDIATANTGGNSVSVLKNTSSGGNFSFAGRVDFPAGNWTQGITIGDINEDGKPDIIASNLFSANISVLKNNTVGGISFEPKVDMPVNGSPANVYIGELNGDTKPEVIVASGSGGNISVFRNTTANHSLSLAGKVDYSGGNYAASINTADIDGDGRPDLVMADENGNAFSVLKNQINQPSVMSFMPVAGTAATKITITGTNFTNVASVTIGGAPVASFSIISDNAIIAVPGVGVASGKVAVANTVGSGFKDGFTFKPYCAAGADAAGARITALQVGTMIYTNPAISSSYVNQFNAQPRLQPGSSNNFAIHLNAAVGTDKIVVFIDYNRDGDFDDDGEMVYTGSGAHSAAKEFSFRVNMPATVDSGLAAMRVRLTNSTTGSNTTACGNSATGQVIDYGPYLEIPPPVIESLTYTSGIIGKNLQVVGKNLFSAYFVSLGGTPATITDVNPGGTLVAIKVGPGATGDAVLKTPGGTAVLKNAFTYAAPVILSASVMEAKAGTKITIHGTNLSGVTAVSFGGVPAKSFEELGNTVNVYAVVGHGASGNLSITTWGGTAILPGFKFLAPEIISIQPATGTTGSTIIIKGRHFKGGDNSLPTAVSFGGSAARSFTTVNDTVIEAIVGNGASGHVTVTNIGGVANHGGFTFVPVPAITSFTPMAGTAGTPITIKGINFGHLTAVNFGGVPAQSFHLVNDSIITAVVAYKAGTQAGSGLSGNVSVTCAALTVSAGGFTFNNYCFAGYDNPNTVKISDVTIGAFNNTSTSAAGYENFLALSAPLHVGSNAMTVAVNKTGEPDLVAVYVDFNRDGDFADSDEVAYVSPKANGPFNFSINVPAIAMPGSTRMRIVVYGPANSGTVKPCDHVQDQVEDYTVVIPVIPAPVITSFSPTEATGDSAVIIHGTHFTGATRVMFGGMPARSFQVESSSRIRAIVGTGTSGSVSVTTSATTSLPGFTFIPLPRPAITSFSPAKAGKGGMVQITGTGFNWATGVSFGGVPAASFIINSATSITAFAGDGATGDVIVTTYSGTADAAGFTLLNYCAAQGNNYVSVYYEKIDSVSLRAIHNNSRAYEGYPYVDFSNVSTPIHLGDNPMFVKIKDGVNYAELAVYIDFNQDGDFDDQGERVYLSSAPSNKFDFNVLVPITAMAGPTKMRIRLASQRYAPAAPCGPNGYGQVQDYTVIIPTLPAPVITSFSPTSATGDSTVTIHGTDLSHARQVSFGGVPARSFKVHSPTEITAVVGAGATGDVTVTTQATATAHGFTFIPLPAPVITSFAPANAATGATVVIKGTGLNWVTEVNFGGAPAASFTVNSATQITAVVGIGATGDVLVRDHGRTATASGFTYLNYCQASGNNYISNYYEKIKVVNIGTFTNNTESYIGYPYFNFANMSVHLQAGDNPSNVSISNGVNYAQLAVYIDFNRDGDFDDAGENVYMSTNPVNQFDFNIHVPAGVAGGATRMRIRLASQRYAPALPCGASGQGQVQDYTVILPPLPAPAITSFTPASAAAGQMVIIHGTHLSGATGVSFGGVPAASFTVHSSSQINAVVGAGTSGAVRVTTPGGSAEHGGFIFTPGFAVKSSLDKQAVAINSLSVQVLPNPTKTSFTLVVNGDDNKLVEIRVTDMFGRVVHHARGAANQRYVFGDNFAAGMYVAEVLQGNEVKTIKMVKAQ